MAAGKGKIERIEKNLQEVRRNIAEACGRAGRNPRDVTILAVTKSADLDAVKTIVDLGLTDLGESQAQQLTDRAGQLAAYLERRRSELAGNVRWHMVGHLQRNKVKLVLEVSNIVHSVDSLRLAEALNDRAGLLGRKVDVLLEVNCSGEAQKHGVAVGAALHLAELVCTLKNLHLVGLMTMAALTRNPQTARPAFSRLREVFEEIRHEKIGGDSFRHLSMGMSQDYPVAVEEGATILRIGTALFK